LSDNQTLRRTPPGQSARWQLGDRAAVTFDLVALLWQHRMWWLVPCLVSLVILGTPGDQVRKLIAFAADGSYRLDLRYFEYHRSARATGDAFVRTGNTSFPPSPTLMARPVYRH